jgi:hypothetical protein
LAILSRYTSIPAALDLLLHKRLVLISPSHWEDQNDREVMEVWERSQPESKVFAACMAQGSETAHHWQVFADGGQGACIRFSEERLCARLDALGIAHGPMSYVQWKELNRSILNSDRLPFMKRSVFRFEKEYRIAVRANATRYTDTYPVPLDLDCVTSVYISGRVPHSLFASIQQIIKSMPGCQKLTIRPSGLLRNARWSKQLLSEILRLGS